jgi:hypothetical protein
VLPLIRLTRIEEKMPDNAVATTTLPISEAISTPYPYPLFQRVWPRAIICLGLALTVAWTAFLGYIFIDLVVIAL